MASIVKAYRISVQSNAEQCQLRQCKCMCLRRKPEASSRSEQPQVSSHQADLKVFTTANVVGISMNI